MMPEHDIIVVGASAGGVEALITLVGTLPRDLDAAVFIVLHMSAQSHSLLPSILNRGGTLHAVSATDNAEIERGQVYVAPPDYHLLVEQGHMRVVRGPKENRHRPAIDPLFRSAAKAYDSRVIGVILTGSLDDGTAGLAAIKQRGGIAVVQDPREAIFPSMPESAIANVEVDYIVPLGEMSILLKQLVSTPVTSEGEFPMSDGMDKEVRLEQLDPALMYTSERAGKPSVYSCPECGGVLWEIQDQNILRFRCRVGHAFSIESMFSQQGEAIESALWAALKTLQENADLTRRMARRARERNQMHLVQHYEERLRDTNTRIQVIAHALQNGHSTEASDVEVG